ncbi:Nem1-Spo7 phosphatase catalytic subunit NEM1 NDAI_0H01420 [Naumovozyma dairenensis CBS 421]|uniref:FCP1 homology domain-containing protein n=1 Tax=Naumovozyma dairenensis (strain ATCC 10597 / BCRC 20456 / CBS 421 / NBRC 0211 / NRRL Y-12639) TaxID=1071378 RepID=G0WEV5_NAUDC|nr:hypothetical protein NDAI_0H01420 [Naumovozyma dairenensis CBS 421]CCD26316.1 hypothetical protein NDAI_0H01420 [Naumovozyma dairenensis CBS 421]
MNALSYVSDSLVLPLQLFKKKDKKDARNVIEKKVAAGAATEINLEQPYVDRIGKQVGTKKAEESLKKPTPGLEFTDNNFIVEEEGHSSLNVTDDRKTKNNVTSILWSFLLFFPKILIIKPILFLWYILTFPLSLIERGTKYRMRPFSQSKDSSPEKDETLVHNNSFLPEEPSKLDAINELTEDDLVSGDGIYLQRDNVKGSLLKASSVRQPSLSRSMKTMVSNNTSFSSKRMGKFLFPKKLIPKSITQTERRKKLVLDLDETLIHSISRGTTHTNVSQGHIVEVKFSSSGVSMLYYVHKRPYCDFFLSKVCKWYDLIIFTASMKEYADPVIDWLEASFQGTFTERYYRTDCIRRDGVGYIKDLTIIKDDSNVSVPQTSTLSEVIILDNSPISYAMNADNAIQVEGWISDPTDTALLNLLPLLEALRYTTDVRSILALKNGERAFYANR